MSENINTGELFETLDQLDLSIVEYEKSFNSGHENVDLVHIIFRYAHNLKSYLFAIEKKYSSELIHSIESNFDLIRKSKATSSLEMIEKCLSAIEVIKNNLLSETEDIEKTHLLSQELDNIFKNNLENKTKTIKVVNLDLPKNEYELLQNANNLGLHIYQIEKLINSNISKEDYEGLFIYEDIKEIGLHITTFPKFDDINKKSSEDVLKIIFASKISEENLGMYIFDPVSKVEVNAKKVETSGGKIVKHDDKPKVLIIEEDFFSRRLFQRSLSDHFICDLASNYEEGITAFNFESENSIPYDIVTLDILESDFNFKDIIKNLRESEKTHGFYGLKSSKIVVISAIDDAQNIFDAFNLGCNGFIFKPATKDKIIDYLKNIGFKHLYHTDAQQEVSADAIEKIWELISIKINEVYELIEKILISNNFTADLISLLENIITISNCFNFIKNHKFNNILSKLAHLINYMIEVKNNDSQYIELIKDLLSNFDSNEETNNNLKILESFLTELGIDFEITLTDESIADESVEEDVYDSLISDSMLIKYITEVIDMIPLIEIKLLELENNLLNNEIISEVLGYVHSVKGNSGLVEIYEIESLCSEIESILQEEEIKKESVSTALKKLDLITNSITQLYEKYFQVANEKENIETTEVEKKDIEEIEKKEPVTQKEKTKLVKTDIRVDTAKLDKLFDLVGELITVESILVNNNEIQKIKSLSFRKITSLLNKVSRELQEVTMSVRMVPIESLFNRSKRIIRDLSLKTDKKVELEISGDETEVDKNIIEMLSDPLMHLIRNAVDHGIEHEAERISKNKPEQGLLKLNAGYEGNEIFITLEDDGKGLDREKIINKVKESNILVTDDLNTLSDSEIWNYIFEAGFSTAEEVSEISGRGVGLDVVKRNLDKIHGKIEVTSKKDKGTIFKLRIPLTLAIIEGLLLKVGKGYYILPILTVNKAFRPKRETITVTMDGQEVVKIKNELFSVIRLHEFFNIEPNKYNLEDGIIIMIESGNRKLCLFVDELIGQQQMVVKGFDSYIGVKKGMTGCTILGNGDIGFILDIESILNLADKS